MAPARAALEAFGLESATRFREHLRSAALLTQRAKLVDALLQALWQQHLGSTLDAPGPCLIATGGYGRGRLFPCSDIDILLLVPDGRDRALDADVRSFLAAAWDCGLELAQSVRTLGDLRDFAAADLPGYTSLLDARLLAGDGALFEQMRLSRDNAALWPADRFLPAKLAERNERHARHADTAHNLEPNLKNGRGALRDLDTARWIAMRVLGLGSWTQMQRAGLLEAGEARRLQQAETWLSDLRFALHSISGRREERLLFDHQPALATWFIATTDPRPHQGVEMMMQRYFRAATDIDRISQALIERIARRLHNDEPATQVLPGAAGYGLRGSAIEALDNRVALDKPAALMKPFLLLARTEVARSLGPDLAQAIARALPHSRRALATDPIAHERFLEILRTRQPYRALTELHRHGLLGALLPPFAKVSGRMQYDLFHVYTVDQHTLFLVRNLEGFLSADGAEQFALAHELIRRVRQPELLFLAALFHDIAKGRGGDHSLLGAADARRYLKRRGFPKADIELVAWLVENHLLMSITAQKQDIQDPEVVRRFAAAVDDWERLECLYLLTVADIRATNPKLWNGWKAKLLGDLYQAARFQLRRGNEKPVQRSDRIRATRLKALELLTGEGCMYSAVESIWGDFPEQSFWRYTPDQLRWLTHAIVSQGRPDQPLVSVRAVGSGGIREIFVRMRDQDGIFATIAATLDRLDLSVTAARIMTCRSGMTLDTFQVLDLRRQEQDSLTRQLEIQMTLTMALSERPLKPRLAKRRATREQRLFRFAPEIDIDSKGSDSSSQLSLVCADRPGLLASIAHGFRDAQVRIHSARIATFGERAEDFFTISTDDGRSLDEAACARLRSSLSNRLSDPGT